MQGGKAWGYPIRVAGITFRQPLDWKEIDSDTVIAEREPDNPYDRNAVKISVVLNVGINLHIGYVPRKIAASIKDENLPSYGKIVWRSEDPTKPGLRVVI